MGGEGSMPRASEPSSIHRRMGWQGSGGGGGGGGGEGSGGFGAAASSTAAQFIGCKLPVALARWAFRTDPSGSRG
jgi:hypothetical protein